MRRLVAAPRTLAALWLSLAAGAGFAQSAPLPPGASDVGTAASAPTHVAQGQQAADSLAIAEAKLDEKDYPGARRLLTTYLSAHPADARALFDLGYLEDAQEQAGPAEADYRKAIAADPKQFESRLALGLLLANQGPSKAAEARTQLEAATQLEAHPANPAARAQADRAFARLVRTSDPEAARQALLAALKISQESAADTLLAAEIAEAAGDPDTAQQAYRGVLASAPAESQEAEQATDGLAHLLIAGKNYSEAELLLRKALWRNAADPVLNTQLADLLAATGKPDQAISVLESLHQGLPSDRGVARMLADLYTQQGEAEKADPLYVQLLAGIPPDEALLVARGDNLIRQKKFAEAVDVLQRAVQLDASDGNAWSSLAFAASVNHQPQLTLDALAMRSKVMSETPATYFLEATSCDTLHQTKRAVEMYKQFLAVAGGQFPDEEWEAKHRLTALAR